MPSQTPLALLNRIEVYKLAICRSFSLTVVPTTHTSICPCLSQKTYAASAAFLTSLLLLLLHQLQMLFNLYNTMLQPSPPPLNPPGHEQVRPSSHQHSKRRAEPPNVKQRGHMQIHIILTVLHHCQLGQ